MMFLIGIALLIISYILLEVTIQVKISGIDYQGLFFKPNL
jgi:hypothetical protein